MSPEDFERQVEFILRQQAQFYADLQRLEAQTSRNSEQLRLQGEQLRVQGEQIGGVTDLLLRLGRIVEEQSRTFDSRINRLVESQERTDERLNILIGVVERYFSNGQPGRS